MPTEYNLRRLGRESPRIATRRPLTTADPDYANDQATFQHQYCSSRPVGDVPLIGQFHAGLEIGRRRPTQSA